jgi:hypothetical protein
MLNALKIIGSSVELYENKINLNQIMNYLFFFEKDKIK